jgi:hypothetical protein
MLPHQAKFACGDTDLPIHMWQSHHIGFAPLPCLETWTYWACTSLPRDDLHSSLLRLHKSALQTMDPEAAKKLALAMWDGIAPVHDELVGEEIMAPANDVTIAAVKAHVTEALKPTAGGCHNHAPPCIRRLTALSTSRYHESAPVLLASDVRLSSGVLRGVAPEQERCMCWTWREDLGGPRFRWPGSWRALASPAPVRGSCQMTAAGGSRHML